MQSLNQRQSEFLSQFFFDIAKGLTLGSVGIYVVPDDTFSIFLRILSVIFGLFLSSMCVIIGLRLINKIR